jgi:alpha-L-fucosidase
VGRNSLLLLNVPPDNRGLIPAEDSLRLMEFRAALDSIFAHDLAKKAALSFSNTGRPSPAPGNGRTVEELFDDNYDTYWAAADNVTTAMVELMFVVPQTFNRVLLQEYIPLGQRVEKFHIEVMDNDLSWRTIAEETTIGYKRIVLTETVTTFKVRLYIDKSRACPVLNRFGLFMDNIFSE